MLDIEKFEYFTDLYFYLENEDIYDEEKMELFETAAIRVALNEFSNTNYYENTLTKEDIKKIYKFAKNGANYTLYQQISYFEDLCNLAASLFRYGTKE